MQTCTTEHRSPFTTLMWFAIFVEYTEKPRAFLRRQISNRDKKGEALKVAQKTREEDRRHIKLYCSLEEVAYFMLLP